MKDLILSIDNGTQSLRAMIFDLGGNVIAKQAEIFRCPWFSKHPGWAEQNPQVYWDALCNACKRLWTDRLIDKERIAGVSITCQRATVINLDKKGRPLRPAIHWMDKRRASGLQMPKGGWGLIFKLLRLSKTIQYLQAEAEANWIRSYQPEIWKNTYKYLLLSGYLYYRMTGIFADSVGCQVGYLPFDYKKLRWASRYSWKWDILKIEPKMLPKLVMPCKVIGEVTGGAADATGIPKGLPVIAGAADKACEVIGCGSLEPSTGCLSYGTTATINVNHNKYIEPVRLLPPYPSAVPGYYNLEVQVYRGYWMVSWFKEEFGHPEKQMAEVLGIEPEALFDKLIEGVPAGSLGLVLQPYWSSGLKSPGPEAKGGIIGFGDIHTRAHVYKSIIEGLAYALREGKELIEKKTSIPITSLRVSGGGSQSRSAMQITADIFGLPTAMAHIYETSCLGAAIQTGVGLGLFKNFNDAVKSMTHIGEVFEPNMKTHELYDAMYKEVYKKMYSRLKPLYERIRKITGYPK